MGKHKNWKCSDCDEVFSEYKDDYHKITYVGKNGKKYYRKIFESCGDFYDTYNEGDD